MAKKYTNKNNDELGCLLGLFSIVPLLLLLFTSKNPDDRKIAWSITGLLLFLFFIANIGKESEVSLTILGLAGVIGILIFIALRFSDSGRKDYLTTKVQMDAGVVTKDSNDKKIEFFEDQLERMEAQVKKVRSEKIISQKEEAAENVASSMHTVKCKQYFQSVEEALQKYKVPSNYQKIMIEQIQKTEIKECPGLIWTEDESLCVLPLIKKTVIYRWPLAGVPIILYEKRLSPNAEQEFLEVSRAPVAVEFLELFPEYPYGPEGVYTGKFVLPVGLEVTNTSGKVLFNLIHAEFYVVDDITQSARYAKEIKELYQKNILKENGILSYESYEEEKELLLKQYYISEKDQRKYNEQMDAARKMGL